MNFQRKPSRTKKNPSNKEHIFIEKINISVDFCKESVKNLVKIFRIV